MRFKTLSELIGDLHEQRQEPQRELRVVFMVWSFSSIYWVFEQLLNGFYDEGIVIVVFLAALPVIYNRNEKAEGERMKRTRSKHLVISIVQ